jgi:hypothetical protein
MFVDAKRLERRSFGMIFKYDQNVMVGQIGFQNHTNFPIKFSCTRPPSGVWRISDNGPGNEITPVLHAHKFGKDFIAPITLTWETYSPSHLWGEYFTFYLKPAILASISLFLETRCLHPSISLIITTPGQLLYPRNVTGRRINLR